MLDFAGPLPIPENTPFAPGAGPYIALMGFGFVLAVLGHLARSKTLIASGIAIVFAAIIIVPLGVYLTTR
ncbi:MAG: hypothetical protein QOE08_390 [Thermoleophilaceae bacterium]|jgi:hypothetical protein|nr:hypothetical protein [Thermoleophilaceae bacterium]